MAVAAIVGKFSFGQLAVPVGLTALLAAIPPAVAYLVWKTMPQVAADFIALWQASPIFLVLLIICAGIMTMLLPIAVVWGMWARWLQRNGGADPAVC